MKIKKKYYFSFFITTVCLVLDQFSKFIILKKIDSLPFEDFFLPGLNIVYVENRGVSFGFLSEYNIPFYLGVLSLIISLYIIYLIRESSNKTELVGLSLILGGALGNGFDRLINGFVIDFIDLYYKQFHWPAFNFADTSITIGAVLFFFHALRNK
tara:strand:+ start:641 stop:1105 length:465 start_codon:yes stop_codon:yes gene_type:complete